MAAHLLPLHVPLTARPTRRIFFTLLLLLLSLLVITYSSPRHRAAYLSSLPFTASPSPLSGKDYLALVRKGRTATIPTVILVGDMQSSYDSARPGERTHLLTGEARMHYQKSLSTSDDEGDEENVEEPNSFLDLAKKPQWSFDNAKPQIPNFYLVPSDSGPSFTIKSDAKRPPTAWGFGISPVEEQREYDGRTLTPGEVLFGFTSSKSDVLQSLMKGGWGWFPFSTEIRVEKKSKLRESDIVNVVDELKVDNNKPMNRSTSFSSLKPKTYTPYAFPKFRKDEEALVILVPDNYTVFDHPELVKIVTGKGYPRNVRIVGPGSGGEGEGQDKRFFRLVKEMWAVDPTREWYIFMDEHTFFPDLNGFYATLSKYDATRDWVIGGITERQDIFSREGRIAYGGAGIAVSKSLMEKFNSQETWQTCVIDFAKKTGEEMISRCGGLVMAQHNEEIATYDPSLHPMTFSGDASGFLQSGSRFTSYNGGEANLFPLRLGLKKEEENERVKSAMEAVGSGNWGRRYVFETSDGEEQVIRDKESGKEMREEEVRARRIELESGYWRKIQEAKQREIDVANAKVEAAKQRIEDDKVEREWWDKRLKSLKKLSAESEGERKIDLDKEIAWVEDKLKLEDERKKEWEEKIRLQAEGKFSEAEGEVGKLEKVLDEVQPKVVTVEENEEMRKVKTEKEKTKVLTELEKTPALEIEEKEVQESDEKAVGHDLRLLSKRGQKVEDIPEPAEDFGLSETITTKKENVRRHKVVVVLGYSITVYNSRGLSDEDFQKIEMTWNTLGVAYSLRREMLEGVEKKTYFLSNVQEMGGGWWKLVHEGANGPDERIEIVWRNGGD